jgi:hypothetical protein
MHCAAEDTNYCDCCACKNIDCICINNFKFLYNFKILCKGIHKTGNNTNYKQFMM